MVDSRCTVCQRWWTRGNRCWRSRGKICWVPVKVKYIIYICMWEAREAKAPKRLLYMCVGGCLSVHMAREGERGRADCTGRLSEFQFDWNSVPGTEILPDSLAFARGAVLLDPPAGVYRAERSLYPVWTKLEMRQIRQSLMDRICTHATCTRVRPNIIYILTKKLDRLECVWALVRIYNNCAGYTIPKFNFPSRMQTNKNNLISQRIGGKKCVRGTSVRLQISFNNYLGNKWNNVSPIWRFLESCTQHRGNKLFILRLHNIFHKWNWIST